MKAIVGFGSITITVGLVMGAVTIGTLTSQFWLLWIVLLLSRRCAFLDGFKLGVSRAFCLRQRRCGAETRPCRPPLERVTGWPTPRTVGRLPPQNYI